VSCVLVGIERRDDPVHLSQVSKAASGPAHHFGESNMRENHDLLPTRHYGVPLRASCANHPQ